MIHVIGDSHGLLYRNLVFHGYTVTIHDNNWCAHNVCKPEKMAVIEEYLKQVQNGDHVVLCYGEIDCRLHFEKKAKEQGRPVEELITNTVKRYGQLMTKLQSMGFDFAVHNIPPTHFYSVEKFYLEEKKYLITADIELRKRIYNGYHDALAEHCHFNGIKLIDLWPMVVGEDGFTRHEYRWGDDGVHLGEGAVLLLLREVQRVFV